MDRKWLDVNHFRINTFMKSIYNHLDDYKIYYTVLPSSMITNGVNPGYRHITGGMSPKEIAKREAHHLGYIANLNRKNGFYDKLESSILLSGIQNPIVIQAGFCSKIYQKYLPADAQTDHTKILVCDRHGGSRLWVAKKHNMDIPCIISDFVGRFKDSNFEELFTIEEIKEKYVNKPDRITINAQGVHAGALEHIHL